MEKSFKQIASLIGDPTRAAILWTLLDGKPTTAKDLAIATETSSANISMHLQKLIQANLIKSESQGRNKYYTFASHDASYAIEALALLVTGPDTKTRKTSAEQPIRHCRTCYDHLAGEVAVNITYSMIWKNYLGLSNDEFYITLAGLEFFHNFGIDLKELMKERRHFIRPCLDWSEKQPHIAGAVGAAMLDKMLAEDWVRRTTTSRAVVITATGRKELNKLFDLSL